MLHTRRIRELDQPYTLKGLPMESKIISFDFMDNNEKDGLPRIIAYRQNGEIEAFTMYDEPQPVGFGAKNNFVGVDSSGNKFVKRPPNSEVSVATELMNIRNKIAEATKVERQRRDSTAVMSVDGEGEAEDGLSPIARTATWGSVPEGQDPFLPPGFEQNIYSLEDLLAMDITGVMRRRAEAGYVMDCKKNEEISEDVYLKDMWNWLQGNGT